MIHLGIESDSCCIQHGHILNKDPILDDAFAKALQLVLAVRMRQFKQTNSVFRRKIHTVRVQVLQEGLVHIVWECADVHSAAKVETYWGCVTQPLQDSSLSRMLCKIGLPSKLVNTKQTPCVTSQHRWQHCRAPLWNILIL